MQIITNTPRHKVRNTSNMKLTSENIHTFKNDLVINWIAHAQRTTIRSADFYSGPLQRERRKSNIKTGVGRRRMHIAHSKSQRIERVVCVSVCFSGCSAFQRVICSFLIVTFWCRRWRISSQWFFVFTQRASNVNGDRSISGISCTNDSFTCVVFVVTKRKNSLSFLCRTHDYEREKDFPVRTARARSLSLYTTLELC